MQRTASKCCANAAAVMKGRYLQENMEATFANYGETFLKANTGVTRESTMAAVALQRLTFDALMSNARGSEAVLDATKRRLQHQHAEKLQVHAFTFFQHTLSEEERNLPLRNRRVLYESLPYNIRDGLLRKAAEAVEERKRGKLDTRKAMVEKKQSEAKRVMADFNASAEAAEEEPSRMTAESEEDSATEFISTEKTEKAQASDDDWAY